MTTLEPGASVVFTHGLRSSPASTAFLATSAAPIMTDGLDVFVHDVIAAITTDPWSTDVVVASFSVTSTGAEARLLGPLSGYHAVLFRGERVRRRERVGDLLIQAVQLDVRADSLPERVLGVGQRHPVLWSFGAGQRRDHRGQVELDLLRVPRRAARVVPQALLLGVRLDERDV